ncbi:MAG TPA: beta-N-acetylhexosaminidase [Pseudonocardiaceae bacterium]|jgi:hexosaminidase|nr:beta-N-acetylhexosaminidase [Pseudonocardiaceae bacterium]
MQHRFVRAGLRRFAVLAAGLALASTATVAWSASGQATTTTLPQIPNIGDVVPAPASVTATNVRYNVTDNTVVYAQTGSAAASSVGRQLATELRTSTGFPLPVISSAARRGRRADTGIALLLSGPSGLGQEGYQLSVTAGGVTIKANQAEGLFDGVQTLRQLLPAAADGSTRQAGPWTVPGGSISDAPRFSYRGSMLDVSRHFFPVSVVERYIDEISLYKINYLHLHLSDDQGWRIAINGWPQLTAIGGSTEVGGGAGGFYTQAQYKQIVAYAQAHYVTIVPEIDGPGHSNAALASYADLNCNDVAPPLYTGTDVGFSSFCVSKPITYTFLNDVIGQLAAMTPGPYINIGGDEAQSTSAADYQTFEDQVLPIVAKYGKKPMGWHDITAVDPPTSAVPEFWGTTTTDPNTAAAAARGNKVVMAPANKAYLDQKYTPSTKLGQNWAAYIEVKDAYDWDPGNYLQGVTGSSVLGVEAPVWSETLLNMADIEYMAFPRLPAIAELGWSPESTHNWNSFKTRLGAQGPRWTAMGMNFYASPQVPWAPGTKGGTD